MGHVDDVELLPHLYLYFLARTFFAFLGMLPLAATALPFFTRLDDFFFITVGATFFGRCFVGFGFEYDPPYVCGIYLPFFRVFLLFDLKPFVA